MEGNLGSFHLLTTLYQNSSYNETLYNGFQWYKLGFTQYKSDLQGMKTASSGKQISHLHMVTN